MFTRKITSILDEVYLNYEQLFHPIQCTALKTRQNNSMDILAWKFFFVFSQFQLQFSVFDVCIVFVTVHYYIQLVHISLETYTYFSPTFVYCPF